jgi:hypothetical protein
MQRFRLIIFLALSALIIAGLSSCDLLKGDASPNQPPEVWFINVPIDSTTFSYAPEVHWQGYDPDGFVNGYEFYDDSSPEALAAYRSGSEAVLQAYIDALPTTAWVPTAEASRTIYLRTEEDSTMEHVFMVRCKDDLGAYSSAKIRTFFRTNLPPNAPRVRWALDDARCGAAGFNTTYTVCDTLFWGERVTSMYPGIEFLWIGSDPDSRLSNIIPLEYSFALVNSENDSMALPIYDDSLRVIGSRPGWSDWTAATQTILLDYETGQYTFLLRVRDDGYTVSDTIAKAEFYAIKPVRDKFMLVVDCNKELALPADPLQMGWEPDSIMAFYHTMIPEAFATAEQLRTNPFVLRDSPTQEPIESFGTYEEEVIFLENRNDNPLPYSYIHEFEVVWIIDDDNARISTMNVDRRELVLQDYMNVGGNVMLSGRRLFNGPFGVNPGAAAPPFFQNYFDMASIYPKDTSPYDDFKACAVGNTGFLPITLNQNVMAQLRYGTQSFDCLPGVEWFGRSAGQVGYNFSTTILNYISCSVDDTFDVTNDRNWEILPDATPSVAIISPPPGRNRLLDVTRVYNISRGVIGDVMHIDPNATGLEPNPHVYISTPIAGGAWTVDDTLEVDYIYIPITRDHDQPIGTRFGNRDGITDITILPDGSIQVAVSAEELFKTSLYTIPFSFMDNTPVAEGVEWAPEIGAVGPVTLLVAAEMLWFRTPIGFTYNQGQ